MLIVVFNSSSPTASPVPVASILTSNCFVVRGALQILDKTISHRIITPTNSIGNRNTKLNIHLERNQKDIPW